MTSYHAGGMVPNHPQNSEFYSHLQAKILADTYYNLGKDLYDTISLVLVKDNRSETVWKLWPAFVNISFSCEIILKLFYENDKGEMTSGHKLYQDLYKKLSVDSQKIISDMTIGIMIANGNENYTKAEFINDLKKSENTFQHERYLFEVVPGHSHNLQCVFLLAFAKCLNILSKEMK